MQTTQHPSHAGVHDTLRHGHRNLSHETSSAGRHPVEARLEGWEATRDSFKMTMHRNMYGMGVPVKSMLERRAVDWVSFLSCCCGGKARCSCEEEMQIMDC